MVDFVTIATEQHRWLRMLDQMLGDDDDQYSSSTATTTTSASGTTTTAMGDNAATAAEASSAPFFSKNAEAELYLLATNFLLYVALVIVVIIVCRIYFPEALQSRRVVTRIGGVGGNTAARPRNYKYRVAEEQSQYGHDDDDEDYGYDDDEGLLVEEEVLDSSSDDEQGPAASSKTPNFLEFEQESLSRKQVLQRLIFCCIMLNITFVFWGILQERMLTRRYPRFTGEYFTYSYALVFTNRFWTLIMSGILWFYLKPRPSESIVIYEYSFPAISNMLSSWCQYEALRYVSFPATTLFKSFKLAPVMLMGKILGNKSYPQYDYVVALMIGVGIAMFMTSTDDLRFGFEHDYLGEEWGRTAWTGVMLLFLFLFFDSFTSQFQSRMFQRHQDLSMVELMLATSAFSTVLSFITLVHTSELYPAIEFVMQHSEIHLHFLLFSMASTVGQLLIYYTIKNFGAVVFTLIMTTRILISIAVSCVMYGHQVSATGFFGLCLVLAAVLYRIRRKAQGQQLLKWQGMEDGSKDADLVQEWHEHVDM